MSGASFAAMMGAGSFTPVQSLYSTAGSFTETIPTGATQVIIDGFGASGGGFDWFSIGTEMGGGSGQWRGQTVALTPSDWGKTLAVVVGAAGASTAHGSNGGNGAATTIANGTFGTSVAINASPGLGATSNAGGLGGTGGSGGTSHTDGNAGQTGGFFGGAGVTSSLSGLTGTAGGAGSLNVGSNSAGNPGLAGFTYT